MPTMGGIIILLAIVVPTLLFADLDKTYIRLMLLCTLWLGFIGFLDDYFKLKARKGDWQQAVSIPKKTGMDWQALQRLSGRLVLELL